VNLIADSSQALNPLAWLGDIYRLLAPPIEWALEHLESAFSNVAPLRTIGAFGLAIIAVTLVIRVLLFPLYQWQLKTTRRIQAEQRRIAPQMQALRRKYKGEPRVLQEEMMKLYKEHDISPLSQMSGCLPLLIQLPILGGLYNGIRDASGNVGSTSFLWVSNLNGSAKDLAGDFTIGAFVTHPWVVLIPAIAAAATFIQTKITIQPPRPNMSDQERQMYSVSRNMAFLAPGMVLFMGLLFPQGLALYWATQSVVMIGQQWYLLGYGGLKVPDWFPGAGRVTKLSYTQPEDKVVDTIKHHEAVEGTRPVRPRSPGANGRRSAGTAASNGTGARTARAETGKGARPATPAAGRPSGGRPSTARPRPTTRSGNPARGGKRKRGR
jgi:YidC/Oxa1 family membrane protein insertase